MKNGFGFDDIEASAPSSAAVSSRIDHLASQIARLKADLAAETVSAKIGKLRQRISEAERQQLRLVGRAGRIRQASRR